MIKKNDKEIVGVFKGTTEISAVYKGLTLVYQNAKTLIVEGISPLTLLKALDKALLGYRVYGNSTQQTYTGKNLWNSTLIAGCMKFADGQYLNYPGYVCNATPIPVEAGQTYTISANNYDDPETTSTGYVFYNNGTFVSSLITTSLTVTIPTGVNQLYYDFRKQSSPSSLSPSDITNVQLEKGSTATSYEPYVGGVASPNPSYPQEIQSVGDKTYNLYAGQSKYTVSSTTNSTPREWYVIEASKTYTIAIYIDNSQATSQARFRMSVGKSGGWDYNSSNYVSAGSKGWAKTTFTANSTYNNQLNMQYQPGAGGTTYSQIMLLEGSYTIGQLPSYESYGYKIPITVSGKNICNPNSFTNTGKLLDGVNGGLNNNTNYKTTDYAFIKAGTYTLSLDNTYDGTGNTTTRMCLYNTNYGYTGNAISDTSARPTHPTYTFTIANDCYYRLSVRNTDTNVQLEQSETETTYEAYTATTTSIYLNEPLRKIGNYTDYIDYETQKVYRNIGHIDLGSLTYSYQSANNRFISSAIPGIKVITGNWMYDLKSDIYGNTLARNYNIGTQSSVGFVWDNRYTDPTALKTALAGHYLDFALGATTEESVTLPSILLNKGTNIISVDTSTAPSDVWIKYKGKA